jgi:hypothetical protein
VFAGAQGTTGSQGSNGAAGGCIAGLTFAAHSNPWKFTAVYTLCVCFSHPSGSGARGRLWAVSPEGAGHIPPRPSRAPHPPTHTHTHTHRHTSFSRCLCKRPVRGGLLFNATRRHVCLPGRQSPGQQWRQMCDRSCEYSQHHIHCNVSTCSH